MCARRNSSKYQANTFLVINHSLPNDKHLKITRKSAVLTEYEKFYIIFFYFQISLHYF